MIGCVHYTVIGVFIKNKAHMKLAFLQLGERNKEINTFKFHSHVLPPPPRLLANVLIVILSTIIYVFKYHYSTPLPSTYTLASIPVPLPSHPQSSLPSPLPKHSHLLPVAFE